MAASAVATWSGRSILWNRMKGNGTEAKNIGWGDSTQTTGSAAASDINLFKPQTEARTAGTSNVANTSFLADTYYVVGSITCAVGAKTITEAGLFDTTTLSTTTTVTTSMTASQTSVVIGAASTIGSGNYYRQIEKEVVLVTGGQNTTTETIVRGRLGSTSAVHSSGVPTTVGGDGGAATANASCSEQTSTVAAANGGSIFAHADFAGIALSVSDSINFTWSDQLT